MRDTLEQAVVDRARQGDPAAWEELFDEHFEAVYAFLRSVCLRKDLAEEATQETFMTAARKIHKYKPDQGTFRTWLLGIARKRLLKLRTAEARRKGRETRYAEDRPPETVGPPNHVPAIHETLARLSVTYRRVLEGKYLHGYTVRQIADQQGLTEDAAESLLRRARQKFAQIHKPDDG